MDELMKIRNEIDEIDRQIVDLFERRMEASRKVAAYKIETGKKIFDKDREKDKLESVKEMAHNPFNRVGVEELFQQIMAMSRKLQYQLLEENGASGRLPFIAVDEIEREGVRVVYQGVEGAYSQAAMREYFGENISSFHVEQWRDAMEAIADGSADYAVLPIENSTAGSVVDMYDLLVEFENYIVGEQVIRCEHCLLGIPGADIDKLERVCSHPQGLMQCQPYIRSHRGWQEIPTVNTALAAKQVAEAGDPRQAAIASKFAGEQFGLAVLAENIFSNEANSTRFIIVTNQRIFSKTATRVSVCFGLPHASGTLYNILSHFIYNGLSLSNIESRPIPGRNWEYRFFIDFEGNLNDSAVKNAIRGIRAESVNMKILGNY